MKNQARAELLLILWWNLFCFLLLLFAAKGLAAQPTSSTISPRAFGARSWRENGLAPASLPLAGNLIWDVRLASDGALYYWNAESTWVSISGSGGTSSHAASHAQGGGDALTGTLTVNITGSAATAATATTALSATTATTATTASSLVTDPSDCTTPNQFATAIDAQGNLTCAAPSTTSELTGLTTLPGLVVWLKADAITGLVDGDPVASWSDSSANALTFTQSTPSLRPTYRTNRLNSLPVVAFDGGDCLTNPSISLSTFSIFIVFYAQNLGMLYEHSPNLNSASAGSFLYTDRNDSSRVERNGGVQSSRNLITFDVSGTPAAWGGQMEWNYASQTFGGAGQHRFHRLRVNGGVPMQATTGGADPGTSTATDEMNLGCRDESAVWLNGEIAEFAVFSPALTSAQIRSVESYLRTKWNL